MGISFATEEHDGEIEGGIDNRRMVTLQLREEYVNKQSRINTVSGVILVREKFGDP